jgi:hypothetical protein
MPLFLQALSRASWPWRMKGSAATIPAAVASPSIPCEGAGMPQGAAGHTRKRRSMSRGARASCGAAHPHMAAVLRAHAIAAPAVDPRPLCVGALAHLRTLCARVCSSFSRCVLPMRHWTHHAWHAATLAASAKCARVHIMSRAATTVCSVAKLFVLCKLLAGLTLQENMARVCPGSASSKDLIICIN